MMTTRTAVAALAAMLLAAGVGHAQTRDTSPPRDTTSIPTISGVIAAEPLADLFPAAGGFDPEDQTSFILLIGNQGNKASGQTHVRYHLKIGDEETIKAEYPIPAIPAGGHYEQRIPSIIPMSWIAYLYARIDQPAAVAERDEKNNAFQFLMAQDANADEHEIEYDILAGAFYERPSNVELTAESGGALATGKRQHRPLVSGRPASRDASSGFDAGGGQFASEPTAPRVKCVGEPGFFACSCGETAGKACSDRLTAANCKDNFDPDGLLPPDGYVWTCPSDQGD